jgi:hypothetical protein
MAYTTEQHVFCMTRFYHTSSVIMVQHEFKDLTAEKVQDQQLTGH